MTGGGTAGALWESGFSVPHGQGPKLLLEYTRQQGVSEKAWRTSHLALDAPRGETERAQISKAFQRELEQQD